jgi:small GTP-binding protein
MSDKKYKKLRFVNPITNKSDVIRIDKSIVENATSFPVSITYFHEQHAISLFIDKNFAVRGAETSVFIDKKVEIRKNIDVESLNIVQSDETGSSDELSDEKIIQSIESNLNDIEEKIGFLVIGSPRVGKTSLIYRYIYDFFNPSYVISNDVKNFKHDVEDVVGKPINVVFWDIPGQIDPMKLVKTFENKIYGIICIFDVTRKSTFDDLKNLWIPFLEKEFPTCEKIFLANKIDLANEREIYKDAIEALSLEKDISIYETSVKSSINITGSLNDAVLSTWIKHA